MQFNETFGISKVRESFPVCTPEIVNRICQPDSEAIFVRGDLGDWSAVVEGDDWEAPLGTLILYTPSGRRQGFCSEYAVSR